MRNLGVENLDFPRRGLFKKYSNKLSMKALVEKDILMQKQEKEMRKAIHLFYVHLSWELKGTLGNSMEHEETRGNLRELWGTNLNP